MSDLQKNLDAAERAYALDSSASNWKRITDAKLALDQEKTRAAALARIAADEAAKLEAEKRAALAAAVNELSPTVTLPALYAAIEPSRRAVAEARTMLSVALDEAHAQLAAFTGRKEQIAGIERELGREPAPGVHVDAWKLRAMLLIDAPTVRPDLGTIVTNETPLRLAEALDTASASGCSRVPPTVWCTGDIQAMSSAALHDLLTGSNELAPLVGQGEEAIALQTKVAAARVQAALDVRGMPNVTEADRMIQGNHAEERVRAEHAAQTGTVLS
mgnify:CR=1 FL=1